MRYTRGVLSAAQLIDSKYRRGWFPSQNEIAEIIDHETGVSELLRAIQFEATRRARAAGRASSKWKQFLEPEIRVAIARMNGE